MAGDDAKEPRPGEQHSARCQTAQPPPHGSKHGASSRAARGPSRVSGPMNAVDPDRLDRAADGSPWRPARQPAVTPGRAEQQRITACLLSKVDALRKARGMSWESLATDSGLAIHNLTSLKRDLVDPRLTVILRLARGLKVDVTDLVGDLPIPIEPRESVLTRRARKRADAEIAKDGA